ncbi:MAG: hypothetical protein AAF740_06715 [Bacteroidota bacterium]
MNKYLLMVWVILSATLVSSCAEEEATPEPTSDAKIRFEFRFDEQQTRLDNLARPASIPAGNAAQTPDFKALSVHYIEFAPSALTQLGGGDVLYQNEEVSSSANGYTTAIDFSKAIVSDEGVTFLEVPISELTPATYEWVRASVAYQNFEVRFNVLDIPINGQNYDVLDQKGTLAGFLGYNTRVGDFQVGEQSVTVNADKAQGFWAFESEITIPEFNYTYSDVATGQAPATTVVNPLAATSPIPAGSCVITGAFDRPLEITGNETEDITVVLSFSIQNSFEWQDTNGNGEWDINVAQATSERVADMGLRGLEVKVE